MRRRKSNRFAKRTILASLIFILSFIGISYAYWNEEIKIDVRASTGSMDIYFLSSSDDFSYGKDVSISYAKDGSIGSCENNNVMIIDLKMKANQAITISYDTQNGGTIPSRPMKYKKLNNPVENGVNYSCNTYMDTLASKEKGWGTVKIWTNEKGVQTGKYEFSLIIPYKQCENEATFISESDIIKDPRKLWRDNICIRGTVEVVE